MYLAVIGGLVVLLGIVSYAYSNARKQTEALQLRYSGISSVADAVAEQRKKLGAAKEALDRFEVEDQARRSTLNREYADALRRHAELRAEVSLLEENLNDISFGVYKPHFSYQTSAEYQAALTGLRDKEREMIRSGEAAQCGAAWTVNNDKRAGQRMTKQYTKLLLRAFNGECDAALANVSWNNISRMEERLRKSIVAINELGSVMQMSISNDYLILKLSELRATFELEEKKHQEKEEQKRVREQIREEEKARQEMEKAKEDAERSEGEYQKLLAKAREEALKATGEQLQKLTDQISGFEKKLDEARQKKERAIARAQLTKSGFVYVISNIGSFGERVFKIGMTRRLEPMDRVDELGDASVPFPFDLHAMLYSDNAPELECALHSHFAGREVNLVNARKEFYQGIELQEIEDFVKGRGLSAQFIRVPEAEEYRKTVSLRAARASAPPTAEAKPEFPQELFSGASA